METKTTEIRDEAGRYIAPPQTVLSPRPAGPWDNNSWHADRKETK